MTRCDDSKDRNIGRELTHASATKFLSKQHAGDFYVILPNGDLSVRDSQGEVDVLTKHGGPASASVVAVKSSAKEGLEDAKTVYLDCYTVGYRFGFTGTRAMKGRPTDAAWDFVTPSRCQDNAENRRGIQAGTKAAW